MIRYGAKQRRLLGAKRSGEIYSDVRPELARREPPESKLLCGISITKAFFSMNILKRLLYVEQPLLKACISIPINNHDKSSPRGEPFAITI